ncbi:hypothetical protein H072_4803 [Dactylellina haptotyla CBS 200.50]|uniref:PH domain-containing protein n=1 Tax=Dactylellina haptotyla (strain CBS 200.50) TaxID=1284197 RepID=S8AEK4_DACHA|nr:hypothetical protein H072_4803 [Dactylellina haptotyla CBS 200.50]
MASAAPKRKLRDPNDIFAALDRPTPQDDSVLSSPPGSPARSTPTATTPTHGNHYASNIRYTKPQTGSRRVLSISKRFMGTTGSLLRRNGSPPRGRRSPPPRRTSVRKTSAGRGGIKPPLDLGPQHSPYDTVNVRERVRKWQASGGGVIEAGATAYTPPTPVNASSSATATAAQESPSHTGSRSPEKRRTMLADYISNQNFDELETSSARWGMEPLALPAPPALSGYGSNPASRRGSRPGSVVSNRDVGEWEDAMSGAEDKSAWNSAPEDKDKAEVLARKKTKKKRVPRDGIDVEAMRARKEKRKKKLIAMSGHESGRETDGERRNMRGGRGRAQQQQQQQQPLPPPYDDQDEVGTEVATTVEIPGAELESREDLAVIPMAAVDDAPPPLPSHSGSPAVAGLTTKISMKSLDGALPSLNSKQSLKSLEGTPASVKSEPIIEGTPSSSLLDDDGIRVVPLRRKFTKAEKAERHRQRQTEREEFMEREKVRIREEERQRYQEMERIREEERQKEIERIKEEERHRVLEEEQMREDERRKIRELDIKMHREREEQKKRERDREERRRQRELIREQERARQIERIREEEKLKVIEEIRQEREREFERLEAERERLRLEELRRAEREEERHQEIMSEIERATQRSTTRAKKKKKERESFMVEEVSKRVGPDALRSKEEMQSAIKATVLEVMGEMFGEIIFEDDLKQKDLQDKSNASSSIMTDTSSGDAGESDTRTRETTPDLDRGPLREKKSFAAKSPPLAPPPLPAHNDITFRNADFKKPVKFVPDPEPVPAPIIEQFRIREPIRAPEPFPELPQSPPQEKATSPPSSPETPNKTSIFSIPKRRINLFGSQSAKRRRKPFQSTIPEESASQLSVEGSEPASPPGGHRVFSFAPRTAAEPISPPVTRQPSAASLPPADPVSPPARQLSIASRSSHHTDYSDHSVASSSQIHRNLPDDDILNLPGQNMSSGLTRSLTSPAAHTNLARDEDPGDEYFVSVHEPLKGPGIRRYKSTADLISILSERRPSSARAKSIRSVRSVRSAKSGRTRSIRSVKNKVVVGTLTLNDLLIELATEELSYTEDLQLLEHRIVPVLLEAKLAKTDKEAAAGKRASPEKLLENNPLKSIVDVNIALKRLNGVHEKLADAIGAVTKSGQQQVDGLSTAPDPGEILKWAQLAKYVYEDYITFWKMDWDEVVINTDVLEAIEKKKGAGSAGILNGAGGSLSGTGRNGKTIDVGYLLKRPLVRTRVLTKLFKASPLPSLALVCALLRDLAQLCKILPMDCLPSSALAFVTPSPPRSSFPLSRRPAASASSERDNPFPFAHSLSFLPIPWFDGVEAVLCLSSTAFYLMLYYLDVYKTKCWEKKTQLLTMTCVLPMHLFDLQRINYLSPSPLAEEAFISFQTLVGTARHKVAEERARLEDEAAACIDASRVRDLQTLEICYGVMIEPNRRVRARDIFEMKLEHSLGKVLTKNVELYLRDEGKGRNKSENAELMICELAKEDEGRKWLAFQPLPVKWISAKQGAEESQMVLEVDARLSDGGRWKEKMVLTADPMIKMEWLHLLGAAADEVSKASRMQLENMDLGFTPVVAKDDQVRSISAEIESQLQDLGIDEEYSEPPTPRMSVVSELDRIPESNTALMPEANSAKPGKPTVAVVIIPGLSDCYDGGPLAVPVYGELPHIVQMMPHYVSKKRIASPPPSTISPMSSASYGPARLQRRRTRVEQRKKDEEAKLKKAVPGSPKPATVEEETTPKATKRSPFRLRSQSPPKSPERSPPKSPPKAASLSFKITNSPPPSPGRQEEDDDELSADETSILSWTEEDMKYGKQGGRYELTDDIRRRNRSESESSTETSSTLSGSTRSSATRTGDPTKSSASSHSRQSSMSGTSGDEDDAPPPLPLHTSSSQDSLRSGSSASSGSTVRNQRSATQPVSAPGPRGNLRRRISSPLKHEYAPSSATESNSDNSLTESEIESSSGSEAEEEVEDERSDDELSEVPPKLEDEDGDLPGPMFDNMIAGRNLHSSNRKDGPTTQYEDTRRDRASSPRHSAKNSIQGYTANASVFTWSPKGAWEKITEDENRVALLENFIEVYKIDSDGMQGKMILSFEVTPVTPIRRGTAVDLSIRAEPRAKFQGGTVMFRSKSPQECEALYNAINTARINACNGFGSAGKPSRKGSIGRSGSVRGYRATNMDPSNASASSTGHGMSGEAPSIIMSESSSLGSLGSAFSAFKGSLRSSIFGGTKSSSGSWMSSSSTSSGLAGPRGIINPLGGIPITGIGGEAPYQGTGYVSNLKVKLWKRESATKWADLGAGRLNIITPPPGHAARGGGGLNSNEKRIVIRDRKGQNTLLDVVLGESCFERVARTGIAVHVPFEDDGFVPTLVRAGSTGRSSIFMLQFKGENETMETFRIVGKQKY